MKSNVTNTVKHKMSTQLMSNLLLEATLDHFHLPHTPNLHISAIFWFPFLPNGNRPNNLFPLTIKCLPSDYMSHDMLSNFLNATRGRASGLHSEVCWCAAQFAHHNSSKLHLTCWHRASVQRLETLRSDQNSNKAVTTVLSVASGR
jgi:hypothetical protein